MSKTAVPSADKTKTKINAKIIDVYIINHELLKFSLTINNIIVNVI